MSVYVVLTILGAARALFAVETTLLRVVLVAWIALGIALLGRRWRPRTSPNLPRAGS
jgi:hypothetical protein